MKITKRHYYEYTHPKTKSVVKLQYERAITLQKEQSLLRQGYVKTFEAYWCPSFWRAIKNIK